jgi:hypothetical protein
MSLFAKGQIEVYLAKMVHLIAVIFVYNYCLTKEKSFFFYLLAFFQELNLLLNSYDLPVFKVIISLEDNGVIERLFFIKATLEVLHQHLHLSHL